MASIARQKNQLLCEALALYQVMPVDEASRFMRVATFLISDVCYQDVHGPAGTSPKITWAQVRDSLGQEGLSEANEIIREMLNPKKDDGDEEPSEAAEEDGDAPAAASDDDFRLSDEFEMSDTGVTAAKQLNRAEESNDTEESDDEDESEAEAVPARAKPTSKPSALKSTPTKPTHTPTKVNKSTSAKPLTTPRHVDLTQDTDDSDHASPLLRRQRARLTSLSDEMSSRKKASAEKRGKAPMSPMDVISSSPFGHKYLTMYEKKKEEDDVVASGALLEAQAKKFKVKPSPAKTTPVNTKRKASEQEGTPGSAKRKASEQEGEKKGKGKKKARRD